MYWKNTSPILQRSPCILNLATFKNSHHDFKSPFQILYELAIQGNFIIKGVTTIYERYRENDIINVDELNKRFMLKIIINCYTNYFELRNTK